jgi:hypothetical protein
VAETWRLQWATPPAPYCGARDIPACPCEGFSYGEGGDLFLLRLRNGVEIDRLHLTPFFSEWTDKLAVLQRSARLFDLDEKLFERDDFPALVSKRPTVQVMHLADYDHDGMSAEFYLQTAAIPCGRSVGVVLGLSKSNRRLHALESTGDPGTPLTMLRDAWVALRDAKDPVELKTWSCGDHGALQEERVRLDWTSKGIRGLSRTFTCSFDGGPQTLVGEEPF